jgi:hypothetical protein
MYDKSGDQQFRLVTALPFLLTAALPMQRIP